MIENVAKLNPSSSTEVFFKRFFGSQRGYVYCPVTEPGDPTQMEAVFFKWPEEAQEIAAHIHGLKTEKDIYFSPTLFKKPELKEECVYGTKFLWVEFNGDLPTGKQTRDIPTPSMKLRTSIAGHEIWFWELEFFTTDMEKVVTKIKQLGHHLDGDLSAWHFESVLRVPGTKNHNTGNNTLVFDKTDTLSPLEAFDVLPPAPKNLTEHAFIKLPDAEDIIWDHKWPKETRQLFQKRNPVEVGKDSKKFRSDLHKAYRRLCSDLADMGLNDQEMLSMLIHADERWGLYSNRTEIAQRLRLIGLIELIRKHKPMPVESYIDDLESATYGYYDLLNQEFEFNWLIENLIEERGLSLIAADSETGKSRFMISFAIHMAIGRQFLIWKPERPLKMLFASLEMNSPVMRRQLETLSLDLLELTEDEKLLLAQNFETLALGSSLHLDKPGNQLKFTSYLETRKPDICIIDTLGVAVQDNIEDAKTVNQVFEYINKYVRNELNCAVVFIHHNRKHGDKGASKDDIFGSVYIRNQMSSIIALRRIPPTNKVMQLEVSDFKARLSEGFKPFKCMGIWSSAVYKLLTPGQSTTTITKTGEAKPSTGKNGMFGFVQLTNEDNND